MLAAYYNGQPVLDLKETDIPGAGEGGLLVRIAWCAICGTDLKTLRNSDVKMEDGKQRFMKLPRILGHEFTGIIEAVAPGVHGYHPGDRVLVFPTTSCGTCYYCQAGRSEMCDHAYIVGYDCDGGFAQYASLPSRILEGGGVIKIPDDVGLDAASVAEPFSCAINCFEITPVPPGGSVVVIGAGPLGSFLCENARLLGASTVILVEKSEEQLDIARCAPVDHFLFSDPETLIGRVKEITRGRGADVVVTACPAPSAQVQALEMVAKCGKVNFFGGLPRNQSIVPIDTNLIHYKECMVAGTHGSRPEHAAKALEYFRGSVDASKYIYRKYKLADINTAFEMAFKPGRMKILIDME